MTVSDETPAPQKPARNGVEPRFSNTNPAPQDGVSFPVHFAREEIDEFCRLGFLKTEHPTPYEASNALWDMIDALRAADLKATPKPIDPAANENVVF